MAKKTFAVDIDGTITENGGGIIHLDALGALRYLKGAGHNVIFVSGRSSVEAYVLSIFGGTTHVGVGENGGCITTGPDEHKMLGDKKTCVEAYELIRSRLEGVKPKAVFPRLTEVVLERTFDIGAAQEILDDAGIPAILTDSMYAFHINSAGIDKGRGLREAAKILSVSTDDIVAIGDSATDIPMFEAAGTSVALANAAGPVKASATFTVSGAAGDGVLEALDRIAPGVVS